MTTFTSGIGDAVVSYENEILNRAMIFKKFDEVIPSSTMLIENPIAVVDKNARRHGDTKVANAFVSWLESAQAQKIYESAGFRPVLKSLQSQAATKFQTPKGSFSLCRK